jgi:dinuclear metal center YbgI/SA1388 family protein
MAIKQEELTQILYDIFLSSKNGASASSNDYCPNGLQVEGASNIKKIITGVSASFDLIQEAVKQKADAIIVHHGYFWKNEPQVITSMKKRRIQALLEHDINLYAYHLPLDIHPSLGNNVMLAEHLGVFNKIKPSILTSPSGIVYQGNLGKPLSFDSLSGILNEKLLHKPLGIQGHADLIKKVAWCTGAGQGFIQQAYDAGVDTFLSGEISEQTVHQAIELGVNYFSCGHHATERYGIMALTDKLKSDLSGTINISFVDLPIPV